MRTNVGSELIERPLSIWVLVALLDHHDALESVDVLQKLEVVLALLVDRMLELLLKLVNLLSELGVVVFGVLFFTVDLVVLL